MEKPESDLNSAIDTKQEIVSGFLPSKCLVIEDDEGGHMGSQVEKLEPAVHAENVATRHISSPWLGKKDDCTSAGDSDLTDSPVSSGPAVHWKGNSIYDLTSGFLGILTSICFFILGVLATRLKDKSQSARSLHIIQATKLAPSLWPILFSGVLGDAIRSLADWKVEQGISLLALEQLMGSLTLASSITSAFRWSIIRLSSVAIILMWSFNPLGSQAVFRGAYLKDAITFNTGQIRYFDYSLETQHELSSFIGASAIERTKAAIRALSFIAIYDRISSLQYVDKTDVRYESNVLMLGGYRSSGIEAASDAWGNVRIPNLETLPDYDPHNSHRWLNTPWLNSVQDYSSLIGDWIEGVDRNFTGNTTFTISSSYIALDCSPWAVLNSTPAADEWTTVNLGVNLTSIIRPPKRYGLARKFFLISSKELPGESKKDRVIYFGSRGSSENWYATRCPVRTTYIDAQVFCMSKGTLGKANCGVNSVRDSLNATGPSNHTWLDFGSTAINLLNQFMETFNPAEDQRYESTIVEWYLQDPLNPSRRPITIEITDLGTVDIKIFEKRLSLLLNTFWRISFQHRVMLGNSADTIPNNPWLNATSTTAFHLPPVYAIDTTWMVIYFFAVAVMFLAALFSLVMHLRCRAPAILGFVSSLIRDSNYFADSNIQGSSAEDGTAKTKRLADLKVRIADLKGEESVGKIAFAPVGEGGMVKRRRRYD